MAHDKAYLVCENKCFVEGVTKEQYEEGVEDIEESIDSLNKINLKTFMSEVPCRLDIPEEIGAKKKYLVTIQQVDKNIIIPISLFGATKISWYQITAGNVTNNSKIFVDVNQNQDTSITLSMGRWYVEIEYLGR